MKRKIKELEQALAKKNKQVEKLNNIVETDSVLVTFLFYYYYFFFLLYLGSKTVNLRNWLACLYQP